MSSEMKRSAVAPNDDILQSQNLCRVCRSHSGQMSPLHEKLCLTSPILVFEALAHVLASKLKAFEECPQLICDVCKSSLKIAYDFKLQLNESEECTTRLLIRKAVNGVFAAAEVIIKNNQFLNSISNSIEAEGKTFNFPNNYKNYISKSACEEYSSVNRRIVEKPEGSDAVSTENVSISNDHVKMEVKECDPSQVKIETERVNFESSCVTSDIDRHNQDLTSSIKAFLPDNARNDKLEYFEKDNDGDTALHKAVMRDNKDVLVSLLTHVKHNNPNILERIMNKKDKTGYTALHLAARHGHTDVIISLLTYVQNNNPGILECFINEKDKWGYTALHQAARHGDTDVIISLLTHVQNNNPGILERVINEKETHGYTALLLASSNGHNDIVVSLLTHVQNNNPGILRRLINEKDNDGDTVLHKAARHGHKDVVVFLLTHVQNNNPAILECFINEKNNIGNTALHLAVENSHTNVIVSLLTHVQNNNPNILERFINEKNMNGNTALYLALENDHKAILSEINHK